MFNYEPVQFNYIVVLTVKWIKRKAYAKKNDDAFRYK